MVQHKRRSRSKNDEEDIELVTEEDLEKPKKDTNQDYYSSDDEIDLIDFEGRSHAITKIDVIIYLIILIVGLVVGWLVNHFMSKLDNIEHAATRGGGSSYYDNDENKRYFFGDKPIVPPTIPEVEKEKQESKIRIIRDQYGEPIIEEDSTYSERWIVKKDKMTGKIIDLVRSLN